MTDKQFKLLLLLFGSFFLADVSIWLLYWFYLWLRGSL